MLKWLKKTGIAVVLAVLVAGAAAGGANPDKYIAVTIDHTKIDEDLTDFPLLIKLSENSGATGLPLTSFLNEMMPNLDPDDDFTLNGSTLPDDTLWYTNGYPDHTRLQADKLRIKANATDTWNAVSSNSTFELTGDFDIQVDFELANTVGSQNWHVFLGAWNRKGHYSRIERFYHTSAGGHGYRLFGYDGSFGYTDGRVNRTDATGKLRLVRNGVTFSGYSWYNGQWNKIADSNRLGSHEDMYIQIGVVIGNNKPLTEVDFDNFKVNTGAVKPLKYKRHFSVTASEQPCYTEIEKWDPLNKQAWLWAKIPFVSATEDTLVKVYWDANMADQYVREGQWANDDFTADDGAKPDEEKWATDAVITADKLTLKASNQDTYQAIDSRFHLFGDFDIQVDYELAPGTAPAATSWETCLRVFLPDANNIQYRISRNGFSTSNKYRAATSSGEYKTAAQVDTTDRSGKLRLARSGAQIRAYFWNGSTWHLLHTWNTCPKTPAKVNWYAYTYSSMPTIEVHYDNFTVNAGVVSGHTGETGSAAAQNVWDDNYVGVWHFAPGRFGEGASPGKINSPSWTHWASHTSSGNAKYCSDNSGGSYWYSTKANNWWKVDLGGARVVNRLLLKGVDGIPGRTVKSFKLFGSNDNTVFTLIYSGLTAHNSSAQTFKFKNTAAYRYWRFNSYSAHSGGSIQMTKIHLHHDPAIAFGAIKNSNSRIGHGTPNGGMATANVGQDLAGESISFDGLNDSVDFGTHASLQVPNSHTLELLLKPDNTTGNSYLLHNYGSDSFNQNRLNNTSMAHWAQNTHNGSPKNCSNNTDSSFWQTKQINNWWKVKLATPYAVDKIVLKGYSSFEYMMVKQFKLFGSNDNIHWEALYSGNAAKNSNNQTFLFNNTNLYRYYRLNTYSIHSGSYLLISKIHLYTRQGNRHYLIKLTDAAPGLKTAGVELDDGTYTLQTTSDNLANDQWHYLTSVWDAGQTQTSTLSINGIAHDAQINSNLGSISGNQKVLLGGNPNQYFAGAISEARISKTARSAAWIKATHHALRDELALYNIPMQLDTDGDQIADVNELDVYNTNPNLADSDNDGIDDGAELSYWAEKWNADADGDKTINLLDIDADNDFISDGLEINTYGTDPANADTDTDNLEDDEERTYWGADWNADPDEDTLVNLIDPDSDNDGLLDGDEIKTHHTNPASTDTDGDGLNDYAEINTYHTNPNKQDTDGDGLSDYDEIHQYNTDPTKVDGDNDGLADGWELDTFGHLNQTGSDDFDGDGVSNYIEYKAGTDVLNPDDRPTAGTFYKYDSRGRLKKIFKIQ